MAAGKYGPQICPWDEPGLKDQLNNHFFQTPLGLFVVFQAFISSYRLVDGRHMRQEIYTDVSACSCHFSVFGLLIQCDGLSQHILVKKNLISCWSNMVSNGTNQQKYLIQDLIFHHSLVILTLNTIFCFIACLVVLKHIRRLQAGKPSRIRHMQSINLIDLQ